MMDLKLLQGRTIKDVKLFQGPFNEHWCKGARIDFEEGESVYIVTDGGGSSEAGCMAFRSESDLVGA